MLNIHRAQIRIGSYASTYGFMLTKVVVCFLEHINAYIFLLVEIVFFSKFDPGARVDEAYFRYFLGKLLQNCKVRFQHSLMRCYSYSSWVKKTQKQGIVFDTTALYHKASMHV